jgi:hypothetical protein
MLPEVSKFGHWQWAIIHFLAITMLSQNLKINCSMAECHQPKKSSEQVWSQTVLSPWFTNLPMSLGVRENVCCTRQSMIGWRRRK